MSYEGLTASQLVDLFADKTRRNRAIVALIGGITATELRNLTVTPEARQALINGLSHHNSKVRWWCIQLMDHIADDSYVHPLLNAAKSDPTPKNRRHAIHALTCEICKPDRTALKIDTNIRAELETIAAHDENESVRIMAQHELKEHNYAH
ncbi:MAG: HEAT repeat domain-containing protein [Aggregatilineales bacterium]